MHAVSQVLIASLAIGAQAQFGALSPQPTAPPPRQPYAAAQSSTGVLPARQSQQAGGLLGGLLGGNQPKQPAPTQQSGGLLGNLFGGNQPKQSAQPAPPAQPQPNVGGGVLPPRQSAQPQAQQSGGLLGGLLGGNQPKQPAQPAPAKQPSGGLLGALNQPKQPAQPAPAKQPSGGLLGALTQPKQPAAPKEPAPPKQPAGGLLENLFGGPAGNTKPIAIKQCPATMRCTGREKACVPHPSISSQFLCVKIDDDCGGRRNRACPKGQACLADPRDKDACVNGWCNNVEGICVTPPK